MLDEMMCLGSGESGGFISDISLVCASYPCAITGGRSTCLYTCVLHATIVWRHAFRQCRSMRPDGTHTVVELFW